MAAPVPYRNAGTFMMLAGAMNIISAFVIGTGLFVVVTGVALSTCVGAACYSCCLWPIVPAAFGVYEIITGWAIQQGKPVRHGPMVALIGVLISVLNLSSGTALFQLVFEIVAYVYLNHDESVRYVDEQEKQLLL
ncbi:MAG: hypothetical protein EA397_00075 [Deltaproteobacteria bacterium]|nr:MAG: hypothetical protein EA397_00075 [Deltaproteobacteria bacterium]